MEHDPRDEPIERHGKPQAASEQYDERSRPEEQPSARESFAEQNPDTAGEHATGPAPRPPESQSGRPRRRLPMRDRRGAGRNRRGPRHGPHHPRPPQAAARGPSDEPLSRKVSLLREVRAEVERIRETLQQVLEDMETVSEQLSRAEQEKEVAEEEIEHLREQLRRLHR